jgi:hypothetical protein
MPNESIENIPNDMSFVDFVDQILITCGKYDKVVKKPATIPRRVM